MLTVEGEIHKYHLYLPINVLITLLRALQWQCRALTRRRCATESQTYYYIIQFIPCKRRRTITASFVDNRAAPLITLNCGHKSRCITQLSSPEQGNTASRAQDVSPGGLCCKCCLQIGRLCAIQLNDDSGQLSKFFLLCPVKRWDWRT